MNLPVKKEAHTYSMKLIWIEANRIPGLLTLESQLRILKCPMVSPLLPLRGLLLVNQLNSHLSEHATLVGTAYAFSFLTFIRRP